MPSFLSGLSSLLKSVLRFLMTRSAGSATDASQQESSLESSGSQSYTSPDCLTIIKRFEGCRLKAYRDPVGVLTIGYGQTEGVYPGMEITQAEADSMLLHELRTKFIPGVMRLFGPLPQHQADALVSFAYNLGVGALERSTLRQKILGGDVAVAADEFLRWHYAGGKSLLGLRRRRAAERARFLGHSAADAIKIGEAVK